VQLANFLFLKGGEMNMNAAVSKIEAVPTIDEKDPQLFRKRIGAINDLGVVGERAVISMVCSSIDSRLILPDSSGQQGLGLKISGTQGTGKSYVVESSLKLQDQSGYHSISNASDKSFFYLSKSMKNKALILAEGAKLQRDSEFGYVVRSLLSEGKAIHQVTAQKGRGNHKTIMKVVEGPVSLITTTTCATLEKQIESRLITVSPDESSKQTRAIMKRAAELASKGVTDKHQNLIQAWQKFHKDLKPARVVIPFAPEIEGELNKQVQLVPMLARRAFKHFLSLIRAIAIFYQSQRKTNESGEIKAEIADYYIASQILSEIFEEKTDIGNETDRERIEFITNANSLLQVKDLTKKWGISKQAVSKWLQRMVKDGIVEWCDATGQRYKTEADTQKGKHSGTAYLQESTTSQQNPKTGMVLPTAFELTNEPTWDINGENAKLYDLMLG
jgi:DNA-binding MarR family transcriptional regulator